MGLLEPEHSREPDEQQNRRRDPGHPIDDLQPACAAQHPFAL
jgi:hypothetical protein